MTKFIFLLCTFIGYNFSNSQNILPFEGKIFYEHKRIGSGFSAFMDDLFPSSYEVTISNNYLKIQPLPDKTPFSRMYELYDHDSLIIYYVFPKLKKAYRRSLINEKEWKVKSRLISKLPIDCNKKATDTLLTYPCRLCTVHDNLSDLPEPGSPDDTLVKIPFERDTLSVPFPKKGDSHLLPIEILASQNMKTNFKTKFLCSLSEFFGFQYYDYLSAIPLKTIIEMEIPAANTFTKSTIQVTKVIPQKIPASEWIIPSDFNLQPIDYKKFADDLYYPRKD